MIQTNNLAKIDKIQGNNWAKSKKSKEIILRGLFVLKRDLLERIYRFCAVCL
jgi:hypothetical protein